MAPTLVAERRKNRPAKETLLKTVIQDGYTIFNVPFVRCNPEINDFILGGNVTYQLANIIEYMKQHNLTEYDYAQF
ncbi:hypothetical protein ACIQ1D_18630 [Lysinibacillus xylanilyticus]|uniref:hypothetical protein n=1 Tax=Lysinibacillus xylanilyticus TaxID=582475 RepID=UPI0037FE4ADB